MNNGLKNTVDTKTLINSAYQIKANAEHLQSGVRKIREELIVRLGPVLSSKRIDNSIAETLNAFENSSNTILKRVYDMSSYISNEVAQKYESLDEETASLLDDLKNLRLNPETNN